MRYLVTLFWTLILGQIVGFLASNLTGGTYSFIGTCLGSIFVAVIVMILDHLTESANKTKKA